MDQISKNWKLYKDNLKAAIDGFKFDKKIINLLKNSIKNDQKIFIAGNGGSACIAMHYACDFSKGANKSWKYSSQRFKSICLMDLGYMTAISNDASYEEVFTQQLINLAKPDDILILISSSGDSKNIVHIAEFARKEGLLIIGITGFNGGKLKSIAHHSAHAKIDSYEVSEDLASIFGHFLTMCLRE